MKQSIHKSQWIVFTLTIIVPAIVAIVLFIISIITFIIPAFENASLERKREMIRELSNTALSICSKYHSEEMKHQFTTEQAQAHAISEIRSLRYGDEGKDYFWITTLEPTMIMHPYRSELEGSDLKGVKDAHGKKLFVECAKAVAMHGSGYINYMWQWKDDSTKIVPKLSYVKGFQPWKWVVGTGIYIEDVKVEMKRMEKRLVHVSSVITIIISILLALMLRQSIRIEKTKQKTQEDLRQSQERYKALVEASTEGALLVLDNSLFANKTMLMLLQYQHNEIEFMSIADIIADMPSKNTFNEFQQASEQASAPKPFEALLRKKDGTFCKVIITLSKLLLLGKHAIVITAKEIVLQKDILIEPEYLSLLFEHAGVGLFKAEGDWPQGIRDISPRGLTVCGFQTIEELRKVTDTLYFADPEDIDLFYKQLHIDGFVKKNTLQIVKSDNEPAFLSITALKLNKGESGKDEYVGFIEDITIDKRYESQRELFIHDLQLNQLVFDLPAREIIKPLVTGNMRCSIKKSAMLMSSMKSSTLLLHTDNQEYIGIIFNEDLRDYIASHDFDVDRPAFEIMRSPIPVISDKALMFEVLTMMQQKNVSHVVVKDTQGHMIGLISERDILSLQSYSPIKIIDTIKSAQCFEDLIQSNCKLKRLCLHLIQNSVDPVVITRIISSVSDALIHKLNEYAIEELGPPPIEYTFLVLGSVGRQEQTLATDQDTAIIFKDCDNSLLANTESYFLQLGEKISLSLDKIGYSICKGNVMAKNPYWCKTLNQWKQSVNTWITALQPHDILDSSIFFDFRYCYGNQGLLEELQRYITSMIDERQLFFYQMAMNITTFKPPLTFFKTIVIEDKEKHPHAFDIKKVLIPLISFARVYALRSHIFESNTMTRLQKLCEISIISKSEFQKMSQMYANLMSMRLKNQAAQIADHKPPDNYIDDRFLTDVDQALLKKIFSHISHLQVRVNHDFKGSGS